MNKEKPLLFVNVEGKEEYYEPSYYNPYEAKAIKKILTNLINKYNYPKDWFSIVTPY
jgi:superfamily I DNA and/or RNA helicase